MKIRSRGPAYSSNVRKVMQALESDHEEQLMCLDISEDAVF